MARKTCAFPHPSSPSEPHSERSVSKGPGSDAPQGSAIFPLIVLLTVNKMLKIVPIGANIKFPFGFTEVFISAKLK